VSAQSWPSKPIRIALALRARGTNDVTARFVSQFMQNRLGQSVIVDNKPGANTRIATEFVARRPRPTATPVLGGGAFTVNPALYGKLPYDTLKDFVPIAQTVIQPLLFSVPAASPAHRGRIPGAGSRIPKQATICSPGNGSGPHLAMELLAWSSGAPLVHVPYKGDAPAVNDLIGGQVGACFNALGTPLPHVRSGRLRGLAVVAQERVAQLPEAPTFAQAGFPAVDSFAWFGLLAPAGTPREIVERLNLEVNAALKSAEVLEKFAGIGALAVGGSAADFERFIRADLEKWARVVRNATSSLTERSRGGPGAVPDPCWIGQCAC
jgi:tripartite-type tricarboxylate transporter receptor subunit TctC